MHTTELYACGYGGYHTCRIPAVVTSVAGTVIVYCEGRRKSHSDWGDIDLLSRRSTDGGTRWEEYSVVARDEGEVTIGNPVPIVDRADGTIHLLFCRDGKRVFHTWSDDDGESYSPRREITELFSSFRFADDYRWDGSHILTGPVHGIQLAGGRLAAPIKFATKEEHPGGKRRAGVIYSDDHGVSWKAGGIVPPKLRELSETTIFECSDGSLCMNARWHEGKSRAVSRSTDGGESWSEPEPDSALPDPVCQGSAFSYVDDAGRHAVLFANLADTGARRGLTLRRSFDDGRSWSTSRLLCEGPSGYSDITVAGDGSILVTYEHGVETYRERISVARLDAGALEGA